MPVKCPPFEEIMCDMDCEIPEMVKNKCGCLSMKCTPKDVKKVPECDKCHEAVKMKANKCQYWECAPKRVRGLRKFDG